MNKKTAKKNEQPSKDHYFNQGYDSKGRFINYWHQVDEILNLHPKTVLEVGVGTKFVARYLGERDIKVTSIDIDQELKPDYVGSVLEMPFKKDEFDVVVAFQVLEHLPFKDFPKAIGEMFRVCNNFAVISLPDNGRCYPMRIKLPKLGEFKFLLEPNVLRIKHQINPRTGHYWEINKIGYEIDKIRKLLTRTGFTIEKDYRIFESHYNHFFILIKKNNEINFTSSPKSN